MIAEQPQTKAERRTSATEKRSVPLEIAGQRKVLGGRAARIAAWLVVDCRLINDQDLEQITITCDLQGDGFHVQLVHGSHQDGDSHPPTREHHALPN